MKLKIEYVATCFMYDENPGKAISAVRLEQVDTLIGEAVWAMERLCALWGFLHNDSNGPNRTSDIIAELAANDDEYQRAATFLASPLVAEWRIRQESIAGKSTL